MEDSIAREDAEGEGRKRFDEYLRILEKVLQDAHPAQSRGKASSREIPPGWVPV